MNSQQSELEQLEARIREAEARLRETTGGAGVPEEQTSENGSNQRKAASKRAGLDGQLESPPPQPEKQSNSTRRPQTGHGRKQSTNSGAKRK